MSLMNDPRDDAFEGRALVATFADRGSAHDAIRELHDEGFRDTWLGVTRGLSDAAYGGAGGASGAGGTRVTSEGDDNPLGAIGRFFSGESGDKSLYDELIRHGVAESTARRLDGQLPADSCILTVDGSNHPELAAHTIEQFGGHVIAGEAFDGATGDYAEEDTTLGQSAVTETGSLASGLAAGGSREYTRGTEALGYGAPDQYARGQEIDQERRLRLREERLNVDKQQVAAGEATVGKEVVERQQSIDVPTYREELFVERRPVAETTTDASEGEIGTGDVIRIPLMREQVQVTKRPVATGEVVVGKRRITETQHVEATTREEQLRVDDPTSIEGRTSGTTTDRSSTLR